MRCSVISNTLNIRQLRHDRRAILARLSYDKTLTNNTLPNTHKHPYIAFTTPRNDVLLDRFLATTRRRVCHSLLAMTCSGFRVTIVSVDDLHVIVSSIKMGKNMDGWRKYRVPYIKMGKNMDGREGGNQAKKHRQRLLSVLSTMF